MKKRKLAIIVAGCILLLVLLFLSVFGNPFILKNGDNLRLSIQAINTETITLNEIVPFEWDIVYTFDPYTSKREIEEIIGFKSGNITETVNEGMTQLIFIKGNKVICNICGYSEDLGYSVSFLINGKNYSQISYTDKIIFSVERKGDIVVLSQNE